MRIEEELARAAPAQGSIVTVGVFDGVHRGHRHLLERSIARARERGLAAVVVTFDPHPRQVLRPDNDVTYLTGLRERVRLLGEAGVDGVAVATFDREVAELPARTFVELLRRHLGMRGLVVGPDFALGRGREGDVAFLTALGQEQGFFVEVVPPFTLQGEVVSSTRVREALVAGDMGRAARLLGRWPRLAGQVVKGDERGRELGFPTANLDLNSHLLIPADGVYVSRAHALGQALASVTSIGRRATFGEGPRLVEVHILDFEGDLYGQELAIDILERLRGQARFPSVADLVAQMHKDVAQARLILEQRALW